MQPLGLLVGSLAHADLLLHGVQETFLLTLVDPSPLLLVWQAHLSRGLSAFTRFLLKDRKDFSRVVV